MPIPALALASGVPLAAALVKAIFDNPQRAIQKATEGLELASGLALSQVHPWYGAALSAKAATRLFGLQPQYHSKQKNYIRKLENVYSRSFRNARNPFQKSSWRRQKIWTKRKPLWNQRKTKKRSWKTKRTWRSSHHATRTTRNV